MSARFIFQLAGLTFAAFVLSMFIPSREASAGDYTVKQCDPSLAISSNSFTWVSAGSPGVVAYPNSGCGEFGLAARSSSLGFAQTYPQGVYGGYRAQAPADTTFKRFKGFFGTLGTCCITDMQAHADANEYPDGSGARSAIFQGVLGNASWQPPSGANGPVALEWEANEAGFNARRLAFGLECRATASCLQSSTGDIRVRARSFEFALEDLVAPTLGEPAGGLLDGGWLRGAKNLEVSANDKGGGLAELTSSFDGGPPWVSGSNCAKAALVYIELRPCPLARTVGWTIDTADLTDGTHTVELAATDVGAATTQEIFSFKVDNNAPLIPEATRLEGEDSWRTINNFVVAWDGAQEVAPIVRAHYEVCPVDGADACLVSSAAVTNDTSVQVNVPGRGAYNIRIWQEDEAGNIDLSAKSSPVTLKFDDEVPGSAYLDPAPGWLPAGEAEHYEQRMRLAGGYAPVSGVSGYSVSTDGADPDGSVDVVGSTPHYPLEGLPEGTTVVKARAVSGSGIPSDAVASTVVRVDKSQPTAFLQGQRIGNGTWHNQPVSIHISGTDQAQLSGMAGAPAGAAVTDGAYVAVRLNNGALQLERGAHAPVVISEDGHHTLLYYVADLAGNQSDKQSVTFKIDQTAPVGVFRALDVADPQRLVVSVSDATSGVDDGWIEYRREGVEAFTRLPTRLEGDRLSARVDDSALAPGRYEFRAVVRDVAGNEAVVTRRADGSPMELGLPVRELAKLQVGAEGRAKACEKARRKPAARRKRSRSSGKARARCRKPSPRAGETSLQLAPGKRVKLAGRLTKGQQVPITGGDVTVEGQLRSGGRFAPLGTARPDGQGRLRFVLPAGASRTVRFRYEGSNTVLPVSAQIVTRVEAPVRLTVNRRRLVNGQSVRFNGRLPGKPIPAGGKLVALQARVGREWRTFATPRASSRGAFKHRYRFTATTGLRRYAFRALVTREAAYPYEAGASRTVHVVVRGR